MSQGDGLDNTDQNQIEYTKDEVDRNQRVKTENSGKEGEIEKSFSHNNPKDESFNVKQNDRVFIFLN